MVVTVLVEVMVGSVLKSDQEMRAGLLLTPSPVSGVECGHGQCQASHLVLSTGSESGFRTGQGAKQASSTLVMLAE